MQGHMAVLLALGLLACAVPAVDAARSRANPLGKVLQLMDSLAAKITKEGEAEAKAYKEFFEWCDDASKNKQFEIKTATAKKAKLEAAMGKEAANAGAAASKIEELAASIATAEGDLKSATSVRGSEGEDFAATEAQLLDAIDTLGRALSMIEKEAAKNPAAFAQLDASNIDKLLGSLSAVVDAAAYSTADKKKLLELVQARQASDSDDEALGAPAAAVYKSHSSGILDVLEDLKEKAEEELSSLRKSEANSKHNYAMLKQSLEDQMDADNKDLGDEKSAKASAEEAKAIATGDLDKTVKDLADAKGSLQTANENCMQTAADHEATVKAREEELKVIAQAKQILADSTSGAEKQAYALLQTGAASRLRTRTDLANAEVLNAVKKLAKEHHSAALAQLASRIAAVMKLGASSGEDPFTKVRGLIGDLIAKLEAQAGSEATERAYCDEQTAKTEAKKSELEDDISRMTAKIDQAVARSAGLKGEMKELQEELAALATQQAEMDKIRQDEHAAYTQAKADLESGLTGVRQALGVLRDYYGGAAASLLQGSGALLGRGSQPAVPETHSKAAGAGGSIVGILETVESDFAKNLVAEETEEDSAQAEYEKTTQSNKVTRTLKDQDVLYKTKERNGLSKSIAELSGDRDTTDSELKAVLEYYTTIKERCIAKPETYEERKARREAEIKGLKEALVILEDETAFVQRSKGGSAHHQFLGMPGQ